MKAMRRQGTSPELAALRTEFDTWRATRTNRGRVPERLWSAAAALVGTHSVTSVSKVLGLNAERLRARAGRSTIRREAEATFGNASANVLDQRGYFGNMA